MTKFSVFFVNNLNRYKKRKYLIFYLFSTPFYPLPFTLLLFSQNNSDFLLWLSTQKYSNLMVLVDENTHLHCYPIIQNDIPEHFLVKIHAGEKHKNLETCTQIWQQYTNLKLDRKALVLHLGGGVLGDMGGFCASIYKRGIRFVQIPTTLLSQVDASVGGKLGIDFQQLKNHLGVFQNPENVWINPIFLHTLPQREKKSGFAEMLKHGIILDKNHWQILTNTNFWEHQDWEKVIKQSVLLKNEVVTKDFKEENIRKLLNFGHTIGHSIESYALLHNISLLHGEAVAIGMYVESMIGWQKGILGENDFLEIKNYLHKSYFLDTNFQNFFEKMKTMFAKNTAQFVLNELFENALQDKKNQNQKLLASVPTKIGEGIFDVEISKPEFLISLNIFFGLF